MSYNYYDQNPNSWRAPTSREHGMESNFSLPTQYPVFGNPSENGVRNGVRNLPCQHPSMPFTSAGYPQATYSDRPPQWFAEEGPDSTSVTVTSNVRTSPRIYPGGSNQAPAAMEGRGVVQLEDGTSGYLPNTRDSNLLPSSASYLPSGRDLNSLPVDSRSYPVNSVITYPLQAATQSKMGNYSGRLDGMGTRNLEPGSQKKPESWLIAKFLDSVNSTENQPNACNNPAADSARHPQTIPSNFLTGSQPPRTVQSFMGRHSKGTVASAAVDLAKTTPRENSNYCWRPPPSNATMRNASPKDDEKAVSSSKTKQEEKLPKKEPGVDSGTLLAWTEYFQQLYLFNVINHHHGEAQSQNAQGFGGATSLPVEPPKPIPKPGYSVNRGATPLTNRLRGRHLQTPAATASGSGELAEEFHKHVSSEEHCRQYQKQTLPLESTNDHHQPRTLQICCKVCNLTIVESFSAHNRRPEHLQKKALIQRGCLLCKVDSFQYYKEYAVHMNGKQHKENQMKSRLQHESLTKNTDSSVNVVDSTQDKSANPDSSRSPDETTLENKTNHMIKQTEKTIRTAFRPTAPQKPKIEIKLSSRQPLLATDRTKAGLVRKIPEIGRPGNKRTAKKLDKSEVVMVESDTGGKLQKRMKIGNTAELSARSLPVFPAAASMAEEISRKQQISSQDNVQMVKSAADADKQLSNSVKDATTASVQSESTLLECKNSAAKSNKGAESGVALLSDIPEVEIGSSSERSAEQNNKSTPNQVNQDEDVFVAVVGFYCKVCKTIYNKEEVSEEQHRQTETHVINLQAVVPLSFSAAPGPMSSLPMSATSKQPDLKKQNEVSMDNKNITEPTRVVDEAHQEMNALQKPGNTAKDQQHLPSQLEKDISGQHLVHVNADFDNQDSTRPSDNLGKHSTCNSTGLNENSTEISSRQLGEQGPKKLKTESGLAHQVQQQNNDHKQLKSSDLEMPGYSTMKQGPRKRKLILAKSCITLGNPKETSKNVHKKLQGTLEESGPQEKNNSTQAERQDAEKIIQTANEDVQVRNKVSNKKPLAIAKTRNLSRKQLHLESTSTSNSDPAVLVEVKQEPLETDYSLTVTTVTDTSGENFKTNRPGIHAEHASLQTDFNEFPSTSDTLQLNDSANFSFNQSRVKKEVITTKENTVQGGTIPKTSAPKSFNHSHFTGPSSETEIEKNNETTQMVGISTMPDVNANDSIIENSIAVLAKKDPGDKLHSGAVIKTGKDLFGDFNADGKNKGNANKQLVGKMASDGKKPKVGKTVTITKTVTNDKDVTNEEILANKTVTSDKNTSNRTVTCDKANMTVANGNSGASEKSITNNKTFTDGKTVADHETSNKTMYNNKANATSGRATEDSTTQQTVASAGAYDNSVIGQKSANSTAVDNKTGKSTTEELEGSKVGNITAVTVNSAQSARNDKNINNVANSKTQDNAKTMTHSPTVKVHNNKSISKSLGSTSESCQIDSLSKSVDIKGVHDSAEKPKLIDSSENSDSSIDTKNEVANVVLPASLEKGCTIS